MNNLGLINSKEMLRFKKEWQKYEIKKSSSCFILIHLLVHSFY